jgi:hypothetical protein
MILVVAPCSILAICHCSTLHGARTKIDIHTAVKFSNINRSYQVLNLSNLCVEHFCVFLLSSKQASRFSNGRSYDFSSDHASDRTNLSLVETRRPCTSTSLLTHRINWIPVNDNEPSAESYRPSTEAQQLGLLIKQNNCFRYRLIEET